MLDELSSSSVEADVMTRLEGLRSYLDLSGVRAQLKDGSLPGGRVYDIASDSALRVYKQTQLDTSIRSTRYEYSQSIWDNETWDAAYDWNASLGDYVGRLHPNADDVHALDPQ